MISKTSLQTPKTTQVDPALYFPVKNTPLQMEAGFYPLGRDLGQGENDQHCFLLDREFDHYLQNKHQVEKERHWITWSLDHHDLTPLHHRVLHELSNRQQHDLGLSKPDLLQEWDCLEIERIQCSKQPNKLESIKTQQHQLGEQLYHQLTMRVQEDITVLTLEPRSALVRGHVCTPSFWDPTQIRDASFWDIHREVPGFPRDERVSERLEQHIAHRGPLVRFVWTVCNDHQLDHHPRHPRGEWRPDSTLWYRVERQITIPIDRIGVIFLIRTYVHPLERLSEEQRRTLREALEVMPTEIARYKGLSGLCAQPQLLQKISP